MLPYGLQEALELRPCRLGLLLFSLCGAYVAYGLLDLPSGSLDDFLGLRLGFVYYVLADFLYVLELLLVFLG